MCLSDMYDPKYSQWTFSYFLSEYNNVTRHNISFLLFFIFIFFILLIILLFLFFLTRFFCVLSSRRFNIVDLFLLWAKSGFVCGRLRRASGNFTTVGWRVFLIFLFNKIYCVFKKNSKHTWIFLYKLYRVLSDRIKNK